jgi:hypothetical protein
MEILVNTIKALLPVIKIMLPLFIIVILLNIAKRKTKKKTNKQIKKSDKVVKKIPKDDYQESDYFKETHTSYEDMITDKGKAGEYATYRALKNIQGYKRFLFNTYIPNKENADKKTEIDIIMIHEKGIYVIECKNYNGYIYGDEASDKWCQMFGNKKKYFFYNPIKQNYLHIKYLREAIGDDKKLVSVIAFGDGATLKKITNTNKDISIINNREIFEVISSKITESETVMQQSEIDAIYDRFKALQW